MITEKAKPSFDEAIKILKSLGYTTLELNCIKTEDELKKIMLEEGYIERYGGTWGMIDDVDPENDPTM